MKNLYFVLLLVTFYGCKKSADGTVEVIPLAPTELKATVVSKDQIDLTWKDNSTNETGYKIERKTDSGVFTEIGSTATDITTFSDKTVSLNTNYTYRVYSFNQVGKSINYSNEVSIKTLNIPTLAYTSIIVSSTPLAVSVSGSISSDGGLPIISKGIVWSTSSNPTIDLSTKTSISPTSEFRSLFTGLQLGTKYYFRSYATNIAGTAYGPEKQFTTHNIPTISTNGITNITSAGAKSGGNIISEGGGDVANWSAITTRGVVWSTDRNPTIDLSTKTIDGKGLGSFQSEIGVLAENSKYYLRAYATNSAGTSYGNEVSFTTAIFTFKTVVGANGRIWMDRNLGATQVATNVRDVAAYGDLYQWGRGKDGHQLRTSNNTATLSSLDIPGNAFFISAYTDWRRPQNNNLWQGVNGINNPCPSGFRIPTKSEWEAEIASWLNQNQGAFDSPLKLPIAMMRNGNGLSSGFPYDTGFYWSSSISGANEVYVLRFENQKQPYMKNDLRAYGFSCRCIKD